MAAPAPPAPSPSAPSTTKSEPKTEGKETLAFRNDKDLSRGIRAHEYPVLPIDRQSARPEAPVGARPVILVPHDGDLGVPAVRRRDGLPIGEVDAAEAVAVRGATVPFAR